MRVRIADILRVKGQLEPIRQGYEFALAEQQDREQRQQRAKQIEQARKAGKA